MRLEYKGKETYKDWANSIWKLGYNLPVSELPEMIGVSMSWVKRVLLKEINYVVYDNKWAYAKNNKVKCLTYIRLDDLSKYIIENGKFTVQTEIIDLASVLANNKKVLNKSIQLYKKALDTYKNRGIVVGTIPYNILDYINEELITRNLKHNYPYTKRTEIKPIEIEPFDIFKIRNRIYYAGDVDHTGISQETIYRQAFLNGDIKIKLGGITIFYKRNQKTDNMKLPYLIPYGLDVKTYNK